MKTPIIFILCRTFLIILWVGMFGVMIVRKEFSIAPIMVLGLLTGVYGLIENDEMENRCFRVWAWEVDKKLKDAEKLKESKYGDTTADKNKEDSPKLIFPDKS